MTSCLLFRTTTRELPGLRVRRYQAHDWRSLFDLLSFLDGRYPGGLRWLDRRLQDVRDGRARCIVAEFRGVIVGVAIETPKGLKRAKLSTLWVPPAWRGVGVGSRLLSTSVSLWLQAGLEEVWVTTRLALCDDLLPAMSLYGFEPIGLALDRYGPGGTELILGWTPDQLPQAKQSLSEELVQHRDHLLR